MMSNCILEYLLLLNGLKNQRGLRRLRFYGEKLKIEIKKYGTVWIERISNVLVKIGFVVSFPFTNMLQTL